MASVQTPQTARLYDELRKKTARKSTRRRIIRVSIAAFNVLLIVTVLTFVLGSPHSSGSAAPSVLSNASDNSTVANPLDQLSSADIAANVAGLTRLPETNGVLNQSQTEHAQMAMASASDSVASKPEVVGTAQKTRADIQSYTAASGDTVASIAAKLGVSSDSLRWSNGISGNTVALGAKLVAPPAGMGGIVYTVKAGDTPDSLATKYKTDKQKIIDFNDAYAENGGLKPGEQILIPDGSVVAVATRTAAAAIAYGGFTPTYGSNGYDYGYCTWYVASRIAVPNNWGNANSWAYYASASGWTVSSTPVAGAIAQTPAGYAGHVAVVEAVSADGTQIKYSDMNGLKGWGQVGYSDWVSASYFPHYIYH